MQLKNLSRIVFVTGILLSFFWDAFAQVTVTRSENKVVIEGRVYYMHVVKAGQTLYSISKAYAVSESLIAKENPGAEISLHIGQLLKIPVAVPNAISTPQNQQNLQTYPADTSYLKHVVKQGETMYSIAKRYNIGIQELEAANPLIVNHDIKIGQLINIPREKTEAVVDGFIYHKVRRRETVYGIARMYSISEEILKKYNPELVAKYPKNGQMLKIPRPGMGEGIIAAPEREKDDSLKLEISLYDTVKIAANYSFYLDSLPPISGRDFNVAYLIPFNFRSAEEIATSEVQGSTRDDNINLDNTINPNDQMLSSRNFLEFMEGSLLALDALRKEGVRVNVFIFDTWKSPSRTREIINSRDFRNIDLIIGPFYSYNVEIVSEFSKANRIPMISPFSGETGQIDKNPYFFQLNTGYRTEFESMANYVAQHTDKNIVLIHSNDSIELIKYNYLKGNILSRLRMQFPQDSIFIREVLYDRTKKTNLTDVIQKVLSNDKHNLVVIPETDEAFVSTVITQLYFQLKTYNISVVGMPHWNTYQNIDFVYFHKLSLAYFSPYYFSYESLEVKDFLKDFRDSFYAEPVTLTKKGGSYAFLGYDVSYHFLKAYSLHGKRFILHLNENRGESLMNDFYFMPLSENGGFENRSLMLVKYQENFEIKAEACEIASPVILPEPKVLPVEPVLWE